MASIGTICGVLSSESVGFVIQSDLAGIADIPIQYVRSRMPLKDDPQKVNICHSLYARKRSGKLMVGDVGRGRIAERESLDVVWGRASAGVAVWLLRC